MITINYFILFSAVEQLEHHMLQCVPVWLAVPWYVEPMCSLRRAYV